MPDPAGLRPDEMLSEFEAVALFVQRGAAVAPGFALTETNAAAVAEVCARLDGLPLAIELAASRVKFISPADMLRRLDHRLAVLTGGAQDLPARQRGLRETIRWSYDLLEPPEQRAFARLSVFLGGWTLEAAEAVVDPDGELGVDTLAALGTLVGNSLVRIDPGHGEVRFDMLETIREFATEALAGSGDHEALRRRHLAYFRALAERAAPELTNRDEGWLDRLEREHDNLRSAIRASIESGDAQSGLMMAWSLWRFWLMRGHLAEGRRSTEELLALPAARERTVARARGLSALGNLAYWQREPESVRGPYEEALALSRDLGDRPGEAEASYNLSFAHFIAGDIAGAKGLLEAAADHYRDLGDETNLAFVNTALGLLGYVLGGDRAYYRASVEEALRTFRGRRQLWGVSQASSMLAALAMADHDLPRALGAALEGLDANVVLGHRLGITVCLQAAAMLAIEAGDPDLAARLGGTIERAREDEEGEAPPLTVGLIDPREALTGVLPEERIDALWQEGRGTPLEEALAVTRSWITEAMDASDPGGAGLPEDGPIRP